MSYTVHTTDEFEKKFKKLDNYTRKMIWNWITTNLENCSDPKAMGKPLRYDKKGEWRYRIGDYRLICEIEQDVLIIKAIDVGHRKDIYKK